jgi:hypothetical protein
MGLREGSRATTVPIVVNGWSQGSVSALSAENPSNRGSFFLDPEDYFF